MIRLPRWNLRSGMAAVALIAVELGLFQGVAIHGSLLAFGLFLALTACCS